MYNLTWDKT